MEIKRPKKTISEIECDISEIEASGKVAPPGVWISKYILPNNKGKK